MSVMTLLLEGSAFCLDMRGDTWHHGEKGGPPIGSITPPPRPISFSIKACMCSGKSVALIWLWAPKLSDMGPTYPRGKPYVRKSMSWLFPPILSRLYFQASRFNAVGSGILADGRLLHGKYHAPSPPLWPVCHASQGYLARCGPFLVWELAARGVVRHVVWASPGPRCWAR